MVHANAKMDSRDTTTPDPSDDRSPLLRRSSPSRATGAEAAATERGQAASQAQPLITMLLEGCQSLFELFWRGSGVGRRR